MESNPYSHIHMTNIKNDVYVLLNDEIIRYTFMNNLLQFYLHQESHSVQAKEHII